MTNAQLASHILLQLRSSGITEYCICPSARNAPFVASLKANLDQFKVHYFFEERAMSFFALGRIRESGRPVAVICTSGTAAGELLPATMEAYYSGLPLVLVTADRPRRFRGTGAPQAAEQVGLFGLYVSQSLDIEGLERPEFRDFSQEQPIHLNICFDEPLLEEFNSSDQTSGKKNPYLISQSKLVQASAKVVQGELASLDAASFRIKDFLQKSQNAVVIVGSLAPHEREEVAQLLLDWKMPVYLEALSGLREDGRLSPFRIHLGDRLVGRAKLADYKIDSVLRIGGVPLLRFWRDLEKEFSHLNVLSLSRLPFSGLGRPSSLAQGSLRDLCGKFRSLFNKLGIPNGSRASRNFIELDGEAYRFVQSLLSAEPCSEPGMMAALSARIPLESRIYLGNSLPIREWDLAATRSNRQYEIWGSRGLNGIDGQVSTFLGFARKEAENWAIIGDLTALYDLPGPWILSQMPEVRVSLVVVNNGGGKIFSEMFPQKEFQNNHQLRFKGWADLWGLSYEEWSEIPPVLNRDRKNGSRQLIEILPNEEATERFWKTYRTI